MNVAQALEPAIDGRPAAGEPEPMRSELEDLDRLSADELTALLQRRFRRFLDQGCSHRQALMLAVGLD